MANPYRHLTANATPHDISITAYNKMIDMLNWWQTNQARSGGGPLRNLVDWDQSVFRTKNMSGALVPTYGIVGLNGPLYGPSDNLAEFKNVTPLEGVEPDAEDHKGGKWGVMLEMAGDGAIGRCCFSGVVPTRVYVNGVDDQYCDVIEAETVGEGEEAETCYLGTGSTGAQILWRENAGSGEGTVVWAIVRLGNETKPCAAQFGLAAGNNWIRDDDSKTHSFTPAHPATGIILSPELTVEEENIEAVGMEVLGVSSYGDPCLKILTPGLWRFTICGQVSAEIVSSVPMNATATTSGGDPAHTHDYDKYNIADWPRVRAGISVKAQNAGTGSYSTVYPIGIYSFRWPENYGSTEGSISMSGLINLDADSLIKIEGVAAYSNVADADVAVQAELYLTAERIGEQTKTP